MKTNLRTRNLAINSYLGVLAITLVGGFATLIIVHIINDVPLKAFLVPQTYAIDSIL